MITYRKTEGSINIIDCDNGYYTVVLDNYVGTVVPDSSVKQIKFYLHHINTVLNDIRINSSDNLDVISFEGKGIGTFRRIYATTIEVKADISCIKLEANVIKVANCHLKSLITGPSVGLYPIPKEVIDAIVAGTWDGYVPPDSWLIPSIPLDVVNSILSDTWENNEEMVDEDGTIISYIPMQLIEILLHASEEETQRILDELDDELIFPIDMDHLDDYLSNGEDFLTATGHIWLTDCDIICAGVEHAITSPYILIQNITAIMYSEYAFNTPNESSIEFCNVALTDTSKFICEAQVQDSDGNPKEFTQTVIVDESGKKQILSRRFIYNYLPMKLATPYDKFKRATGYTNVNLHTNVDNDSNIRKAFKPFNSIRSDILDKLLKHVYKQLEDLDPLPISEITLDMIENVVKSTFDLYLEPIDIETLSSMAQTIYNSIQSNEYNIYAGLKDVYNHYAFDEVESRKYDEGIYSLNAYRTTKIEFHDEASRIDERP